MTAVEPAFWDEFHTGVLLITKLGKLSAKYYSVSKKSVRTPSGSQRSVAFIVPLIIRLQKEPLNRQHFEARRNRLTSDEWCRKHWAKTAQTAERRAAARGPFLFGSSSEFM